MQHFRGVSSASDPRFGDQRAKELRKLESNKPKEYSLRVDLKKVQRTLVDSWITTTVTGLLDGFEDDILIATITEFINAADGSSSSSSASGACPNPCELELLLTPFLGAKTRGFVKDLWSLLASATANPLGIPSSLLEAKKAEILARAVASAASSSTAVLATAGHTAPPPSAPPLPPAPLASSAASSLPAVAPTAGKPSRWGNAVPTAPPLPPEPAAAERAPSSVHDRGASARPPYSSSSSSSSSYSARDAHSSGRDYSRRHSRSRSRSRSRERHNRDRDYRRDERRRDYRQHDDHNDSHSSRDRRYRHRESDRRSRGDRDGEHYDYRKERADGSRDDRRER